jgi:hypothetical protein
MTTAEENPEMQVDYEENGELEEEEEMKQVSPVLEEGMVVCLFVKGLLS